MIQRIQTVFFALAVVCLGLLFVFNLYTVDVDGVEMGIKILNHPQHSLIFCILTGLCLGLTVATIARYANRKFQLKLARLTLLILTGLMVLMVYDYSADEAVVNFSAGIFMPMGAIVFTIMGIAGIQKDEALIKSADRIR